VTSERRAACSPDACFGRRAAAEPSSEQTPACPRHRLRLGVVRRWARGPQGGKRRVQCAHSSSPQWATTEVACDGCQRDQRQSGFSPETPVIPLVKAGRRRAPVHPGNGCFAGLPWDARDPTFCLPCRRSRVRIPSAALEKACVCRPFLRAQSACSSASGRTDSRTRDPPIVGGVEETYSVFKPGEGQLGPGAGRRPATSAARELSA
jgi:hypothetical protein